MLSDSYASPPATIGFQVLVDHVPQGAGAQDIMSGITLYPGGDARRLLGDAADSTNDLMRRVAQKHRSLQAILVHLGKRGQDTQRVLGQIGELTREPRPAQRRRATVSTGRALSAQRAMGSGRRNLRTFSNASIPIICWPSRLTSGCCNARPAAKSPGKCSDVMRPPAPDPSNRQTFPWEHRAD